jgi:hypothetical protein
MSARRIEAEWLDHLPADDPRARRSRRELARVNGLMSNARILAALVRDAAGGVPRSLVELGAGDGRFAARLARALGDAPPGASFTLVDRQPATDPAALGELARLGWEPRVVEADALDWLSRAGESDAIVANLFLHHLESAALAGLFAAAAARTRAFAACEPRRSALAAAGSRLLVFVGCGAVTRHDAVVSVRAGFAGGELSALWPARGWSLEERPRGLFTHAFSARRA